MDKTALEEFKEVTTRLVDEQAFVTNNAHKLASTLPPRLDGSDESIAQNILRILLAGQRAILLALSVLLHEGDTEIEIPQAFKDAFDTGFEDTGRETNDE